MCLNPIKIRIKSRCIDRNSCQPLYIQVPCGKCAECMELKRDQWYLRNYWHSKECFDKGGYVLFDTLTYKDSDLPHLSMYFPELEGTKEDYACFCYEHYVNFMKRLRINLTRGAFEEEYIQKNRLINLRKRCKKGSHIYDDITAQIDDLDAQVTKYPAAYNLNAFCVCEYGSDEYYMDDKGKMRKGTFRPHYHMLFYVNIPGLDCVTLAKYIYKSWNHGKTDSVDAYGNLRESYVRNHNCIGKDYSRNSDVELRRVSKYVAKYITKDNKYSDRLKARVQFAAERLDKVYTEYDNVHKGEFITDGFEEVDTVLWGPQNCVRYEFGKDGKVNKLIGEKSIIFVPKCDEKVIEGKCMRLVKNQERIDHLKRVVDGFHLQGLGFGLYGIEEDNLDLDEIINEGVMSMPDSKTIVKKVPVPMYYVRKLFYSVCRDVKSDSVYYKLKFKGKEFKKKSILRGYENKVKKYTNMYMNLPELDKVKIDSILDGRELSDYVSYLCFYKNMLVPEGKLPSIDEIIKRRISYSFHPYARTEFYLDREGDIYGPDLPWSYESDYEGEDPDKGDFAYYRFDEFCSNYMFNCNNYNDFKDFDKLDEIFVDVLNSYFDERQKLFDHNEKLQKKYKKMKEKNIF